MTDCSERAPAQVLEGDVENLRRDGFSDRDILDANLTVAYFAYANRLAQGLGLKHEEHVPRSAG